jgi:hypothetical protein
MVTRKPFITLTALWLVLALASNSYADISNAAVLFLRIAPGARAAGMGEAFVAIADDATATHWNPAGLGAYPLADTWLEAKVPSHLQPLKAIATLKKEGGKEYQNYDVWAITSQGLARYDHRKWHLGEVFSTKTDQTVEGIVKSYYNVDDEERLAQMVQAVAETNNAKSLSYLEKLRDSVMAVLPGDYSDPESLESGFDSLLTGYQRCLINWEKVREVEKLLSDGMKDSALTEMETDRINFAVEKSRNRFIPEELMIPYSTLFGTELTAIASVEEALLVGLADGLFSYNGKRWRKLTDVEDLPSNNIHCLFATHTDIYIGTDNGLARFTGQQVTSVDGVEQLPKGSVTAIGAGGRDDVWIALNNDLYHWDGENWSNSFEYTVVLDDTPEKIAEKFALYGTTLGREKYLAKFHELNQNLLESGPGTGEGKQVPTDSMPPPPDDSSAIDSRMSPDADTATEVVSPESENPADDTALTGQAELETAEATAAPGSLAPGLVVRAPYLAEVKGNVNAIYVSFNKVWIGTDFGVMVFNTKQWALPGYRDHVVEEGQTLNNLIQMKAHKDLVSALSYAAVICDINDLEYELDEPLVAGQVVKIPRNPAAAAVNGISGQPDRVYFATTDGLLKFDNDGWGYVYEQGMDCANAVHVEAKENGLWVASDRKIVIKANGRAEIALMYAKWLPELADDLYYGFFSFTANTGSWGTFGGNVTYISYGRFARTTISPEVLEEFDSFDIAFTASYGTALSGKLKGGISAKVIYSRLSDQGAGAEQGQGTSTGFGIDLGLLYQMSPRLNWGLALTNLGPKMAYIDASQADELPRNLSFGFAYKLLQSEFYRLLVATEVNKIMVGLGDGFREELKQVTLHGGAEFMYANIIAFRGGYIHDEEGKLKTFTFGVGLYLKNTLKFDFGYYFGSSSNESRKGIKPLTFSLVIP